MADKELNNPKAGPSEGQPETRTEGEEKDEGGKATADKFKSEEAEEKSYAHIEAAFTKSQQENAQLRERMAKLEGYAEAQKKESSRPAPLTDEQKKAMTEKFKADFNKDPLPALHNFVSPYVEDARLAREDAIHTREELKSVKTGLEKQEAAFQAQIASQEDPALFQKLLPDIEKELREDKNLKLYENPYTAAFNKVAGKSYKKLAKMSDAEREAFVEGPSGEPPTDKSTKESRYKSYVMKHSKRRTVL